MQLFLDTANLDEIRTAAEWGIVSGITTNPSLMAKETGADFKDTIQDIASIIDGPISAEVVSTEAAGMIKEGEDIATWHENVVVKIPTTSEGLKAINYLSNQGIDTNATLIFSPTQALMVALAGATYASPFIGRLDDNGHDGMELIEQIVTIYENYSLQTNVLAASIRGVQHVVQAAMLGADVATMPLKVMNEMLTHPLTDIGLEKFLKDWKKRG